MTVWTAEVTAEIVRRFRLGEEPSALAKEFGLTRHQVNRKLTKLGLSRQAPSRPTTGARA